MTADAIRRRAATGGRGEEVWLVLGGGGLRGLAHVGAWRALEETPVTVRGLVGCSVGALVGALIASGMDSEELASLARALGKRDIARINRRAAWINGIRQQALFQGDPFRDYIQGVLPVHRWSDLQIPLQVNAIDLATGHTEWFGTGANTDVALADAIYASAALPVFYPPATVGERIYVDGGADQSLPIHRAAELGASEIVAVDVGGGQGCRPEAVLEQGMLGLHERLFSLMAWRRRAEAVDRWTGPPLLMVRPRLEEFPPFAFGDLEYFMEEGYRAAREALDKAPAES